MKILPSIILSLLLLSAGAIAQQSKLAQAADLYTRGEMKAALAILEKEDQNNAAVRHYMGLVYLNDRNYKKARTHLEKALAIEPANQSFRARLAYAYFLMDQKKKARAETDKILANDPRSSTGIYLRGIINLADRDFDKAIEDADLVLKLEPQNAQAHTLKSDTLLQKYLRSLSSGADSQKELLLLREAGEVLDKCLSICGQSTETSIQIRLRAVVTAFIESAERNSRDPNGPPEAPEPGVTGLKIISKPRASYTDQARQNNISGTIKLKILFSADGTIPYIAVLNGLGGGLNEQAIRAARQVTFTPRMRDGKPVDTVLTIMYSFTIY